MYFSFEFGYVNRGSVDLRQMIFTSPTQQSNRLYSSVNPQYNGTKNNKSCVGNIYVFIHLSSFHLHFRELAFVICSLRKEWRICSDKENPSIERRRGALFDTLATLIQIIKFVVHVIHVWVTDPVCIHS